MPFKSRAQARKCYALRDPNWDCDKWARLTPNSTGSKLLAFALVAGGGLAIWWLLDLKGRRHITHVAEDELKKWAGGLTEATAEGTEMIRKYWAEGAKQPFPGSAVPWSAAFISYVTNKGKPGVLEPAGSHMIYAEYALEGKGRYRVFPVPGTKVKVGDIILRNRSGGTVRFEDIGHGHQDSHSDIVTAIKGTTARAIGGNKNNAVQVENYALNKDKTLNDPRAIAILKLT